MSQKVIVQPHNPIKDSLEVIDIILRETSQVGFAFFNNAQPHRSRQRVGEDI